VLGDVLHYLPPTHHQCRVVSVQQTQAHCGWVTEPVSARHERKRYLLPRRVSTVKVDSPSSLDEVASSLLIRILIKNTY
jgi:hypothetical protein